MNVRIVAVYEDSNCPDNELQAARGMCWYLEFENQRVLFDTGTRGKILTENMSKLMIHPDDIETTCGQCHEDLPPDFAHATFHKSASDPESGGEFFVREFYYWFISIILLNNNVDSLRNRNT